MIINSVSADTTSIQKLPRCNILIVDDEPKILEQLEQDLAFEDFNMIKVHSAEEGLKWLKE